MIFRLYVWFGGKVASLSLFQKLVAKVMLIALLPLLLVALLSLRQADRIIMQATQTSNERAFEQTAAIINGDVAMNLKAIEVLTTMPDVLQMLSADPSRMTRYEQVMDLQKLGSIGLIINLTGSVFRLKLYVRNELFYAREHFTTYPLSEIMDEEWFADIGRQRFVYLPVRMEQYVYRVEREVFSIATGIQRYKEKNEIVGVAMLDISVSEYAAMLAKHANENILWIVDESGAPVLQSNHAQGGTPLEDTAWVQAAIAHGVGGTDSQMYGRWYVQWRKLDIPGWYLLEAIPSAMLRHGQTALMIQVLAMLAALMPVIVLVIILFTRTLTEKLHLMAHTVKRFAGGDSAARMTITSSDVLGSLQHDINLLFERMNQLMLERFELGQQAKNADMDALQSQINPHFLYNTLDMLYWMAKNGEPEALPEIIIALSGFYRKSLAQGKEIVRIADEVEHIRYYINIQNRRFAGAIAVHWAIAEDVLEEPIMKLLLQPIVENAVQHGIQKSVTHSGSIHIAVSKDARFLYFLIEDDGVGMTQAQIDTLMRADISHAGRSYGIYNVQRRIKLLYGEEYGLLYESETGKGTKVHIQLPRHAIKTHKS